MREKLEFQTFFLFWPDWVVSLFSENFISVSSYGDASIVILWAIVIDFGVYFSPQSIYSPSSLHALNIT